jgi:hypothetical protein
MHRLYLGEVPAYHLALIPCTLYEKLDSWWQGFSRGMRNRDRQLVLRVVKRSQSISLLPVLAKASSSECNATYPLAVHNVIQALILPD